MSNRWSSAVTVCCVVSCAVPAVLRAEGNAGDDGGNVGGPMVVDSPVDFGGAEVETPIVAGGPDGWLIAWTDRRDQATNEADVYGARVALDGTLLDPTGFLIAATDRAEKPVSVAWGEDSWLVIWARGGEIADSPDHHRDVLAARIDRNGQVVDDPAITIAATRSEEPWAGVAWIGESWLITWPVFYNLYFAPFADPIGGDLIAVRLSSAGVILDADPFLVAARSRVPEVEAGPELPIVVAADDSALVLWSYVEDLSDISIRGTRVRDDMLLDPEPFVIAPVPAERRVSAAWHGSGWLALWASNAEVHVTPIDREDPPSVARPVPIEGMHYEPPELAWVDDTGVMTWAAHTSATDRDSLGMLVCSDGAVAEDSRFTLASGALDEWITGLAASSSFALVVALRAAGTPPNSSGQGFFRRIDLRGVTVCPIPPDGHQEDAGTAEDAGCAGASCMHVDAGTHMDASATPADAGTDSPPPDAGAHPFDAAQSEDAGGSERGNGGDDSERGDGDCDCTAVHSPGHPSAPAGLLGFVLIALAVRFMSRHRLRFGLRSARSRRA